MKIVMEAALKDKETRKELILDMYRMARRL
jgi:hypothetical protein